MFAGFTFLYVAVVEMKEDGATNMLTPVLVVSVFWLAIVVTTIIIVAVVRAVESRRVRFSRTLIPENNV